LVRVATVRLHYLQMLKMEGTALLRDSQQLVVGMEVQKLPTGKPADRAAAQDIFLVQRREMELQGKEITVATEQEPLPYTLLPVEVVQVRLEEMQFQTRPQVTAVRV
jgi:hypothetical protein